MVDNPVSSSPGSGVKPARAADTEVDLEARKAANAAAAGETPAAPRTDADEAMALLKVLRPDGPWVLTACIPMGGIPFTRTFDDEGEARAFIETRNQDQNLYYTGNPCGSPKKKPEKADITAAVFHHSDNDPDKAKGETPAAAKARILAAYEAHDPPPSIIIDSGNGLQALWLLEEPYPFPRPEPGLDKDALKAAADEWARPIEDRNRVLAAATGANPSTRECRPAAAAARHHQLSQPDEARCRPRGLPGADRQADRRPAIRSGSSTRSCRRRPRQVLRQALVAMAPIIRPSLPRPRGSSSTGPRSPSTKAG